MSGVYFQPRSPVLTSTEIIKAFESLAPSAETNTPEQTYFSGLKRANQVVKFLEPAYLWQVETSYPLPQVLSVYVDSIDGLTLAAPLRIETDWEAVGTYGLIIRFDRFRCSGFAILS